MILFFDPYDATSRAVLMALHEYGVEFDGVVIDRSSGYAHLAPSVIELNPQLETPGLLDGDEFITGLTKIEEHIAAVTGRLSVLHNADPEIVAIVSIPLDSLSSALSPAPLRTLKRLYQLREVALLSVLRKRHPALAASYDALRAKIRTSRITRRKKAGTEQTLRSFDRSFGQFEDHIREREFVVGSNWTIADGVWASVIACLLELGLSDFIDPSRRPATSAFFDRMADRPSFQVSIDPQPSPLAQSIRILSAVLLSFISPNAVVTRRSPAPSFGAALHSVDHLTSNGGVRHGS